MINLPLMDLSAVSVLAYHQAHQLRRLGEQAAPLGPEGRDWLVGLVVWICLLCLFYLPLFLTSDDLNLFWLRVTSDCLDFCLRSIPV
jgi:hypothetical protein